MSRWLMMQCGERRCALPVASVQQVAPVAQASPLPRMPAWVEGIAAYGRAIVPQIALGALIDGPAEGAMAVVAESGAGPIALRVTAVDRVVDLVERADGHADDGGIVAGTVRRGRFDVALLDLSGLSIPAVSSEPVVTGDSGSLIAGTEDAQMPSLDLVCAVAGGHIALPLARVLSVERAGGGVALCDTAGRNAEAGAAAMAVTVSQARGRAVLGVVQVLGPRRAGTPGYHNALLLDCDGLSPLEEVASRGDTAGEPGPSRVMYLLAAGGRQALLPATKALCAGVIEHWRALPGRNDGPDGLVPLGGTIMPALDLARLFGDAARPRTMALALDARGSPWAIACDSISERRGSIEGRPVTRDGLATLGQAQVAEGLLPVLDADRLLLPGQTS